MLRKLRIFLSILALSCIMLVVFGSADSIINIESCSNSSQLVGMTHHCRYNISTTGSDVKIAEKIVAWKTDKSNATIETYHLKEDYILPEDQKIILGKNVYVGICTYGKQFIYSESQIELPEDGSAGFFVYDCTMHGCYNEKEPALNLSNGYVGYLITENKLKNGNQSSNIAKGYYYIDSSFDFSKFIIQESEKDNENQESNENQEGVEELEQEEKKIVSSLTFADAQNTSVCFNGVKNDQLKNYLSNLDVKARVYDDCIEPSYEHECLLLEDSFGITQEDFIIGLEHPEEFLVKDITYVHLKEDLSWDKKLELPDNKIVVICKNGFDINFEYGKNVYVLDCETHSCISHEGLDFKFDEFMPINQSYVDFLARRNNNKITIISGNYAFMEDVNLSSYTVEFAENAKVVFCLNGYNVTTSETLNLSNYATVLDCTKIEDEIIKQHTCSKTTSHVSTICVGNESFNYLFDSKTGEFIFDDVKASIALTSNVLVDRPLTIPTGVDLTICLNGYTIQSTQGFYESNYKGFKRNGTYYFITVEYGATLTILDCSKTQSGCIIADIDLSSNNNSSSPKKEIYLGTILNLGSFELNGGILFGGVAISNCGFLTVENTNIIGLLGLAQDNSVSILSDNGDYPLRSSFSSTYIKNSRIDSIAGIVLTGGEMSVENTEINANLIAIGEQSADLSLSDVQINITTEHIYNVGELLNFDVSSFAEIEFSALLDYKYIGVAVSSTVNIDGDINVSVQPELMQSFEEDGKIIKPVCYDILLFNESACINVGEDVIITDSLCVATKSQSQVVANDQIEAFVPIAGFAACVNQNNELIFVSAENSILNSAIVSNYTISVDGLLKLQISCKFDYGYEEAYFLSEEKDSLIKVSFGSSTYNIEPKSVDPVNNLYVYEFDVAPKDYKKDLTIKFTDGYYTWTGVTKVSMESLLLSYLEEFNDLEEEFSAITEEELAAMTEDQRQQLANEISNVRDLKNIVIAMLNYCNATASYFQTEKEYDPIDEPFIIAEKQYSVEEAMNEIDANYLEDHKFEQSGDPISGVNFTGASLLLEAGVKLRFYLYITRDMNDFNITCNNQTVELLPYKGVKNGYYFEIDRIQAQNVKTDFKIVVKETKSENTYTIKYGVLSYLYAQLANENTPEELKIVSKALWMYALMAENYLNSMGE